MPHHTRRQLIRGIAIGASSAGIIGSANAWSYSNSNDPQTSNRDYQNTDYSTITGHTKIDDARREKICKLGRNVVFPVLTAISMEDGVPVSTKIVAESYAAFSGSCSVLHRLDKHHEQQVKAAGLYIANDETQSILQPP